MDDWDLSLLKIKKVYMIFNDWHVTMDYHELFRKLRYSTYN